MHYVNIDRFQIKPSKRGEGKRYGAVLVSKSIKVSFYYNFTHLLMQRSRLVKVSFCEGLKFPEAHEVVPIPASFRDKSVHKFVKTKRAGYGNK